MQNPSAKGVRCHSSQRINVTPNTQHIPPTTRNTDPIRRNDCQKSLFSLRFKKNHQPTEDNEHMTNRLWSIKEYPFHPEKLHYYETIFTIGNGYIGTRGSFEEGYTGDTAATFVHGLFNHAEGELAPELVNCPDWTRLNIWIDDTPFALITHADDPFHPPHGLMLGYERRLHMDTSTLRRTVLFKATSGNTVRIEFERYASLSQPHLMRQKIRITAIDGSPEVIIEAVLDGAVTNQGVQHWGDTRIHQPQAHLIAWHGITQQSKRHAHMVTRFIGGDNACYTLDDDLASIVKTAQLSPNESVTFYKDTALFTDRDANNPLELAIDEIEHTPDYDTHRTQHNIAWRNYWQTADIQIKGDEVAQLGIRFTTYHVLIATPHDWVDSSIGAKTLSGYGYAGHVFWDTELFMLPVLTLTQPQHAKNLLMYRYKRLDGARKKAQDNGYAGAMFPWESTDTGHETTPIWTEPKPPDGQRLRIYTGEIEIHISADIAYSIMQYWQWTGDDAFMRDYGAEMVIDTAVFWGSRAEETARGYELTDIIGPDEYHDHVDNNVYTNRMAQWHLSQALDVVHWLSQHAPDAYNRLVAQLQITPERLTLWRDIVDRMYIPFDADRQVHVQFDGFFDREFIPVMNYTPRVGGIWEYLGYERVTRSQLIKQADVVMLMALLGEQVGSHAVRVNNLHTYYARCDHGSSLSPAMHAWVAARLGIMNIATEMMEHAILVDLEDNKGNVHAGIHGAASGGAWQMVVFGFCGLHLVDDTPTIAPTLPKHWESVTFSILHKGRIHTFTAENNSGESSKG
jgi:kojibiose phosphorylase